MKELGITKGESVYPKAQPVARNGFYILTDTAFIGEVGGGYLEIEQYKALAELFADAGNTAQKCGLLPSELLKQRDELKRMINSLSLSIAAHPDYVNGEEEDEWHDLISLADELIKSTEQ